ncbi:cache domain-containing sensor histidine kinase [Paenibacillus sacheonensis]|uniref:HAMP domain-containing protein n=1 Tax=Paenibacillus sacheonensis TaxID=742054 RepID=A0A7X4YK03_9BACL|nr:sensor histidine kinase [Paenibacillus sacheonensis]MBM7563948.1 two-component system sensor histidine kinase YesM [Paenibacillus sacheonensis]NBC67708.1 HAMP domain-containing protein [Paenibacillus sacheonensis]
MKTSKSYTRATHALLIPYRFITRSLYRKIWFCFFVTITITVIALGLDYYVQTSSDIKDRAIGNMELISSQSAATLESYMLNVKNFAWEYFGDKDFQQFVKDLGADPETYSHYSTKFSQFMSRNPVADLIMVSQLNGGNRLTSGGLSKASSLDIDYDQLKTIAIANDGKGVWLPTVAIDPRTKKSTKTLIFVQAVKTINFNSDNPVVGVMFIRLSSDFIKGWLGEIGNEEQGQYELVDAKDGKVMFALDEKQLGERLTGLDPLFAFSYHVNSRYLYADHQGERTLFVSNKLDNTSWVLVGQVPLNVLLEQVNELALRTLIIGAVCLLGAMIIASILSSKIITPLKQLKKGIISIEKGDYNISVPVSSKDEIGYFVRRFNQMAKEINMLIVKVYEADLVKKDAEIKSLQSQINPHFLYNTLGMIDSLAALHDDDRISMISSNLAKMFRYNISAGHMSTLQAEIRQLEIYLSIQQVRFSDRLSYSIDMEDGLQTILTPKLLLQPLVENSFMHGIDHLPAGGEIRIRACSLSDTDAAITVWNNGPPIHPERLASLQTMLEQCQQQNYAGNAASSIGLFNVQYRIKLVFGNHYGLALDSGEEQGTTVTVWVKKMRVEEAHDEINDRR